MVRKKIKVSEASDPEQLRRELRTVLNGRVLGEAMTGPIEDCISQFHSQGMKLASLGNAFTASREFQVGEVAVTIVAQFGPKPSIIDRARKALGL